MRYRRVMITIMQLQFIATAEKLSLFIMEKRSVTSGYHGSKISASQQPFLTEAAICIFEQWKKSMGYRFVPECNHAQENDTCYFSSFFLPYLHDHGLLRSRNLLPWQLVVKTSPI